MLVFRSISNVDKDELVAVFVVGGTSVEFVITFKEFVGGAGVVVVIAVVVVVFAAVEGAVDIAIIVVVVVVFVAVVKVLAYTEQPS